MARLSGLYQTFIFLYKFTLTDSKGTAIASSYEGQLCKFGWYLEECSPIMFIKLYREKSKYLTTKKTKL